MELAVVDDLRAAAEAGVVVEPGLVERSHHFWPGLSVAPVVLRESIRMDHEREQAAFEWTRAAAVRMEDLLEPDPLAIRLGELGDDRAEGVVPLQVRLGRAELGESRLRVGLTLRVVPDVGPPPEPGHVVDPCIPDRRLLLRPNGRVATVVFGLGARIQPQVEAGAFHFSALTRPGPADGGPGGTGQRSKLKRATSLRPRRSSCRRS